MIGREFRKGRGNVTGIVIGANEGADLWNNNPPSFDLLIPGNASGGLVFKRVSVGGSEPSAPGRYHVAPGYRGATAASIADGFSMILALDSSGWVLNLTGLEDAGTNHDPEFSARIRQGHPEFRDE